MVYYVKENFGTTAIQNQSKKNIEIVEKLYRAGHHIIIYSARHRKYYQTTEAWLIKNGVYYHALSLEKLGCDLYIDDKAVNVKDIDKLI